VRPIGPQEQFHIPENEARSLTLDQRGRLFCLWIAHGFKVINLLVFAQHTSLTVSLSLPEKVVIPTTKTTPSLASKTLSSPHKGTLSNASSRTPTPPPASAWPTTVQPTNARPLFIHSKTQISWHSLFQENFIKPDTDRGGAFKASDSSSWRKAKSRWGSPLSEVATEQTIPPTQTVTDLLRDVRTLHNILRGAGQTNFDFRGNPQARRLLHPHPNPARSSPVIKNGSQYPTLQSVAEYRSPMMQTHPQIQVQLQPRNLPPHPAPQ